MLFILSEKQVKRPLRRSFQKFCFSLLFFPILAMADINTGRNYYPFLAQGFNITNYQKCMRLTWQCPLQGNFPDESCIMQIMHANKVCEQLEKLSQMLPFTPTAKQVKGFTVLDLFYIGDGQHAYYIISKGSLINTTIDPRTLNKVLAKKYKKVSFFIVNWAEPKYHVNPDGSQRFTVILRINKDCLACSVIGWATLAFNFTKEGHFLGAKLKDFKLDPMFTE